MGEPLISELFLERSKFVLIGLTGRTGSGCTTAANILESEKPEFPLSASLKHDNENFYRGLDARRYGILREYAIQNWNRFYSIKVSDLISAYILKLSPQDAAEFIVHHGKLPSERNNEILSALVNGAFTKNYIVRKLRGLLNSITSSDPNFDAGLDTSKFKTFLKLVRKFTNDFKKELKLIDNNLYISIYQAAGDSIRSTGNVTKNYNELPFSPTNVFQLPETINRVVKLLRLTNRERAFIVIDAIRNPYEARYFKERYSAFYLVSINAPDEDRSSYLQNIHKFTVDQLKALELKESGKGQINNKGKDFTGQNVKRCIEMSDIHIFNPRNELENVNVLKAQLAWYVSLMMHPGLVTPTSMERIMQMAYTAKTNSGCISRQVGAAITDAENSIKAIGWNDVATGQIPCSLRSINSLLNSFDPVTYSVYERTNSEFREKAKMQLLRYQPNKEQLNGRNLSYCFKDLKNSIDSKANQVHTRSLHAEENAFLQLSKHGGPGIKGGKLYTTASPCELCAKKAYQLGVSEIVFIDPYPGIARENILATGSNPPKLIQFRGAVGKGYHQLYEQTLPYKDELTYFENELKSPQQTNVLSS